MSQRIVDYMQLLTVDEQARADFHRDPDGAMTSFGLSLEERTIVASGDPARIRAAVAKSDSRAAKLLTITFLVLTWLLVL
jgi:hypothetical protein